MDLSHRQNPQGAPAAHLQQSSEQAKDTTAIRVKLMQSDPKLQVFVFLLCNC